MDQNTLAYCGLYCGGCKNYQYTKNGIKSEPDNSFSICKGCLSDVTTPFCTDCDLKACNKTKGLKNCKDCEEYPCEKLTDFINNSEYTYHLEVVENMQRLKEIGEEAWVAEQEKRYTCSNCNNKFHWWDKICAHCGATLI